MRFAPPGVLYINDNSDSNVTQGLVLNQGANDNCILTLKSSDVSHGMTSICEADTYGSFDKNDGDSGGLRITGLSDSSAVVAVAAQLRGFLGGTADTTKSTTARSVTEVYSAIQSGTSIGAIGANGNVFGIRITGATKFIFDADGDSHQDVGTTWTNFDDKDDVALLHALSAGVSRNDDPIRAMFGRFLEDNREILTRAKLVTFNEDGHHFVNMSRLLMLVVGAVRQQAARIEQLERMLPVALLENKTMEEED
jgi:hypothetical protein